jgi:hypothetical protein
MATIIAGDATIFPVSDDNSDGDKIIFGGGVNGIVSAASSQHTSQSPSVMAQGAVNTSAWLGKRGRRRALRRQWGTIGSSARRRWPAAERAVM